MRAIPPPQRVFERLSAPDRMAPPIKVAVIGAGLTGSQHAAAAKRVGASVIAVTDPDPGKALRLASSLGGSCIPMTSEELTARAHADVVHVCTPPSTHGAIVGAVLHAGMHVICEKPLAQTAQEVNALLEMARARSLQLCPVHQFPFQQGMQKVLTRAESLGTIRHIEAEICTAGGEGMSDIDRHQVTLDILPHPLSLSRSFLPQPLSHCDWKVSMVTHGEIIVTGVCANAGLSFVLSTHGRPTSNSFRVIGDAGTATADLFHGYAVLESGEVSRRRKMTRPFIVSGLTLAHATANGAKRVLAREMAFPGLRELVRRFYAAVAGNAAPPISADAIADIAFARDRIIAASESGPDLRPHA